MNLLDYLWNIVFSQEGKLVFCIWERFNFWGKRSYKTIHLTYSLKYKQNKKKKKKKKDYNIKVLEDLSAVPKGIILKFYCTGVPFVVHRVRNLTSIHEDAGLILGHSQWVKNPSLLCLWCRLEAAALIQPLALEFPYARGAALLKKKLEKIKFYCIKN